MFINKIDNAGIFLSAECWEDQWFIIGDSDVAYYDGGDKMYYITNGEWLDDVPSVCYFLEWLGEPLFNNKIGDELRELLKNPPKDTIYTEFNE